MVIQVHKEWMTVCTRQTRSDDFLGNIMMKSILSERADMTLMTSVRSLFASAACLLSVYSPVANAQEQQLNILCSVPIMLIFYGLALFNASKYAIDEINFLGVLEIGLGIIAIFWVELGLLIWLLGFGILHIIYGSVIYFKYEK